MGGRPTQRDMITLEEARRARSLRQQGFTWVAIADRYGFGGSRAVQAAIARLAVEAARADVERQSVASALSAVASIVRPSKLSSVDSSKALVSLRLTVHSVHWRPQ
jgi:hypothetical protein